MGDIKRRYIRKHIIAICLVITLMFSNINVKASNRNDYLDITLADIIITWYNASGVAIGSSELVNEIQSAYGNITIDDLIEADVFKTSSILTYPGTQSDKDLIRDMIGYGNLTAPTIEVRPIKLKQFLEGYPVSENAEKALRAMFGYETDGGLVSDIFSASLGIVIGTVANIGKIGYNLVTDVVSEGKNEIENFWPYKTLKSVYDRFTNSEYFQGLLQEDGSEEEPTLDYVYNGDLEGYDSWGYIQEGQYYAELFLLNRNVVPFLFNNQGIGNIKIFNLNANSETARVYSARVVNGEITKISSGDTVNINGNGSTRIAFYGSLINSNLVFSINKALSFIESVMVDNAMQTQYVVENNPWGTGTEMSPESPTVESGVTNYINKSVGNILSDNYINLSPNVSRDEYMYIFTRDTYNNVLNEITNNNDNGSYIENTTVINNYNNTYIQESVPDARPTSAPAESEQPIQPFISPRPSPIPEEVESVIYEGGISEEITKKFPFCIPWDIKAMIDNLWSPQARAPYIHWDANFGTYGKLGEVDIDLAPYDGVAAIFRSTTLLLWIVGLLVLTKNLLG